MHVELTEARLKQMAKTLRADLGKAAPSYQHTLDLLAKMLGYRSYEAMKPALHQTAVPDTQERLDTAPHDTLAVLRIEPEDRPDRIHSEPLILVGRGRTAVEAALNAWLDAVGADRDAGDPPHRILIRPVHFSPDAGTHPNADLREVVVCLVEAKDRTDGQDEPLIVLAHDSRTAERVLTRSQGDRLPSHRRFYMGVHDDPHVGTVGRRGERLPETSGGKPANLFYKNLDPVMDGTRYYPRPTYYDCGICGALHPADWDGDCRDDNNRFSPDELDARHGENGWDEVDMPGNPFDEMITVHHPTRGHAFDVIPVEVETTLIDDAMHRIREDYRRRAMRYDYTPDAADDADDPEPRWRLHMLTDRGMESISADPSMFPDTFIEQAVPEQVRRALERLHALLGLEHDQPVSVYIDAGRTFAFLGGMPEHLVAHTQSEPTIAALYCDRDQKGPVMEAAPQALGSLLVEIDRDW